MLVSLRTSSNVASGTAARHVCVAPGCPHEMVSSEHLYGRPDATTSVAERPPGAFPRPTLSHLDAHIGVRYSPFHGDNLAQRRRVEPPSRKRRYLKSATRPTLPVRRRSRAPPICRSRLLKRAERMAVI